MKPLNFLLCILLFCSCGVSKKTITKKGTKTDSTATTKIVLTEVKKKDSSTIDIAQSESTKKTDSNYTKKTVIKTYYSNEFNFGNEAGDSCFQNGNRLSKVKKPPVLFQETTITETGTLQRDEAQKDKVEHTGRNISMDSTAAKVENVIVKNTATNEVVKSKETPVNYFFKFLKFLVFILILISVWYLYKYYKK